MTATSTPPKTLTTTTTGPSAVLRKVIKDRGLTGYRIALMADLKRPDTLYRWLAGERGMHLSVFDQVCEALGLKLVEDPAKKAD